MPVRVVSGSCVCSPEPPGERDDRSQAVVVADTDIAGTSGAGCPPGEDMAAARRVVAARQPVTRVKVKTISGDHDVASAGMSDRAS
jgi:hypothetical protein